MSVTIEHDAHVIEDRRFLKLKSASDIFQNAGGIVIERNERKIAVVRISFDKARSLCEEHGLSYVSPILSFYEPSVGIIDVTPCDP